MHLNGERPAAGTVSYHINIYRGRLRAVCTCGWTSDWFTSSGVAGGAWDLHASAEHRLAS